MNNMQLILVVETNAKAKTDFFYIDTAIKHYYVIDETIKLIPVFMDGKTNYNHHKTLKCITEYVAKFTGGSSTVIYFLIKIIM